MYYFTIRGIECRCDTAEELRAAVDGQPAKAPTATTTATTTTAKPTGGGRGKHRRKAKAKAAAKDSTNEAELRKLPYIQGGITWDVAKREAKKLGRSDVRQVRSDLKARQNMGE